MKILFLLSLLCIPTHTNAFSLVDIAKYTHIEIGDFDFCKEGYAGYNYTDIVGNKVTRSNIQLCSGKNKKALVTAATHELGHTYWELGMDEEQRQQWREFNKRNNNVLDGKRSYSLTNEKEDFADTFQFSFSKDPVGIRSDLFVEKLNFVNSLKKQGIEKFNRFDFSALNK